MSIEINNVTFKYEGSKEPVFSNLTCLFSGTAITNVTGPHGCGMTTFAKLISGMLKPDHGHIIIDRQDVTESSAGRRSSVIGMVQDDPRRQLVCRTVEEELEFGLKPLKLKELEVKHRMDHYLDLFSLEEKLEADPRCLSMGEMQLLVLASAMIRDPAYLIIDDPFIYLDDLWHEVILREFDRIKMERHCGIILMGADDDLSAGYIDRQVDLELIKNGSKFFE